MHKKINLRQFLKEFKISWNILAQGKMRRPLILSSLFSIALSQMWIVTNILYARMINAISIPTIDFQKNPSQVLMVLGVALVLFGGWAILNEGLMMLEIRYKRKMDFKLGVWFRELSINKFKSLGPAEDESEQFQDVRKRLQGGGPDKMVSEGISMLTNIITMITSVSMIAVFEWYYALIFAVVMIPRILVKLKVDAIIKKFRDKTTGNDRWAARIGFGLESGWFQVLGIFDHWKDLYLSSTRKRELFIEKVTNKYDGIEFVLSALSVASWMLIYWFSARGVLEGQYKIGTFILIAASLQQFQNSFSGISRKVVSLNRTSYSVKYYLEFMNWKPLVATPLNPSVIDVSKRFTIEFDNVSFAYPGTKPVVLKNISLTIKKGEHVGLVGMNGSGKTTLMKLLLRVYDPIKGSIRLNGIDIRQYPLNQYQALFAGSPIPMLDQLTGRAVDVITFASPLKVRDYKRSEQAAQMVGLLDGLGEEGLMRKIGVPKFGGIRLSSGNLNKLMMAQAIYRDSPFMILDEPAANLDAIAEQKLFSKYQEMMVDKSSLMITHRLKSLKSFKRILVFSEGELVSDGTHEVLMELNGLYKELFDAQSS